MGLKQNFGILVALPICERPVQPEWAINLKCYLFPTGMNHTLAVIKGKEIGEARNEFIEIALRSNIPYVFFLDDDVRIPLDGIVKLHHEISKRPDAIAVAGIYPPKRHPIEPMVYRKMGKGPSYDWKYGDVFECEAIATGAMMVSTAQVATLPKPWFRTCKNEAGISGHRYTVTDDIWFCERVLKVPEYKIYAHGGVIGSHWDHETNESFFLNDFLPENMRVYPSEEAKHV